MVSGDIKVMNPTLVICHLDDGATLNMELVADSGKGYVPATANRPVDAPIGLIPIDSLYSPVRQVAYKVDNARIGQELDYDKLSLTVRSEEHTYELQSLMRNSYAVFCLKKKRKMTNTNHTIM